MLRIGLLAAVALAACTAHGAQAQTYKFKSVKYPKNQDGLAGINASGTAVGGYFPNTTNPRSCFVLTGKKETPLVDPDGVALSTECWGINTAGNVVGDYTDANGVLHGYVYNGTKFTTVDPPGTSSTTVHGINDSGVMVGGYLDASGASHGFLFDGTKYTKLDIKGGSGTQAFGINNAGTYTIYTILTSDSLEHSYYVTGKTKTELVFPNYAQVAAHGINTAGQIVATIIDSNSNYTGGVFDPATGKYYAIGYPKAGFTVMDGINDSETLVGRYQKTSSSPSIAYIATGKL